MATSKKTPTKKAAPKKSAVFKTAEKPRTDYKIGVRVKVKTKHHEAAKGHTCALHDNPKTCIRDTPTGKFIAVNLGTKSMPIYHEARPVRVKGY